MWPMTDFWKSLVGTLTGALVGGLLATGTAYLVAKWSAEDQRKLFQIQQASGFLEFLSLRNLPRSGDVPVECEQRLKECRRERLDAYETYFFLPDSIQHDFIKSYGPQAEAAASDINDAKLPLEQRALIKTLKETRMWLTGEKSEGFPLVLPCADWAIEQRQCMKK